MSKKSNEYLTKIIIFTEPNDNLVGYDLSTMGNLSTNCIIINTLNENKSYYLNKIEKASSSLERKIFDCFMKGYKSKEIAELLNIDIRCVYNAKYRLQKKMDKSK